MPPSRCTATDCLVSSSSSSTCSSSSSYFFKLYNGILHYNLNNYVSFKYVSIHAIWFVVVFSERWERVWWWTAAYCSSWQTWSATVHVNTSCWSRIRRKISFLYEIILSGKTINNTNWHLYDTFSYILVKEKWKQTNLRVFMFISYDRNYICMHVKRTSIRRISSACSAHKYWV